MTALNLDAFIDKDADILIQKVESKTKRIFEGFEPIQQRAIYRYQFPRRPKKLPPSMKSRVINLYDPMANRGIFILEHYRKYKIWMYKDRVISRIEELKSRIRTCKKIWKKYANWE